MKTFKQIKQLVETIAISYDGKVNGLEVMYSNIINAVRNKYLPFFQFNIDASNIDGAQELFNLISENVQQACTVPFLPDGQNTIDKIGGILIASSSSIASSIVTV